MTSGQLFFNKAKGLMGIKPCKECSDGAYKLYASSKGTRLLQALKPLTENNIKIEKTVSVPIEWDDEMGMMVADVSGFVKK
jgi:hypothetical protein